jgi:acyl-CoA hydrolase
MARITAHLIDDGSTIQLRLTELSQPVAKALGEKNDFGVHTEV